MTDFDASSLKFWESFSEFGFWLVIIGVFGESVDLISKWVVRRRKTPLPEKIEKWLLPVESFFWVILCVGLAMEFRGGHNAKQIEDRENARLNKEAGQARKDAADAIKQAAKFEFEAAALEKQIMEASNHLAQIDPRNLPLNSVTAFVTFTYKTNNVVSNKVVDSMILQFHGDDPLRLRLSPKNGNLSLIELSAAEHPSVWETQKNAVPDSFTFSIALDWDSGWREFSKNWNQVLNRTNLTAAEIANSDFDVSITPTFLKEGTLVVTGSVEVWFNGPKIQRDFSIPSQWIGGYPIISCLSVTSSNTVQSLTK